MDLQTSLLLNCTYFHQDKSMDELRQTLWLAMELEETRTKAQEQLKMRDGEISQLKDLLSRAIKERDEAQVKCQKVFLEKQILQQQFQQSALNSGISSVEDDPRRGKDSINGFSASDCDESIVSSPQQLQAAPPPPPPPELQRSIGRCQKGQVSASSNESKAAPPNPPPRWPFATVAPPSAAARNLPDPAASARDSSAASSSHQPEITIYL